MSKFRNNFFRNKIRFISNTKFNKNDAKYFVEYFDSIMNSSNVGKNVALHLGIESFQNLNAIIELGVGTGSFLIGVRSVINMNTIKWIGIDTCNELLNRAPAWIEKYNMPMEFFNYKCNKAIIFLSPCLIETTVNDNSAIALIKHAASLSNTSMLWLSVHNKHTFQERYPVGKPSSFNIKDNIAKITTINVNKKFTRIKWSVHDKYKNEIYNRKYKIRLKTIEQWCSLISSIPEVESIAQYSDDNEDGIFRKAFFIRITK